MSGPRRPKPPTQLSPARRSELSKKLAKITPDQFGAWAYLYQQKLEELWAEVEGDRSPLAMQIIRLIQNAFPRKTNENN